MKSFIIAGAAWGEHYTDMLINYCLPSILPSISAVVGERKVIIHIHTDNPYKINSSAVAGRLRDMGIEFLFRVVDSTDGDKYLLLGKYQALGLDFARRSHADFHSLMPDHVYSQEFFIGLMAAVGRGHKAITRLCLSTRLEGMAVDLAPYRHGDVLTVPSAQLARMAMRNLHPRSEVWRISGEEYPDFHVAFEETGAAIWLHSPHQSIVYLDRDAILPAKTYLPLDNELDKVIPMDIPVHSTHPDDCMGWVEIARDMPVKPLGRTTQEGFLKKYRDYAIRPYPAAMDICL